MAPPVVLAEQVPLEKAQVVMVLAVVVPDLVAVKVTVPVNSGKVVASVMGVDHV